MKTKTFLKRLSLLAATGALLLPLHSAAEGTWLKLAKKPKEGIGTMLLLSDGTVMAQGGGGGFASTNWYQLSPDGTGGYTNGLWASRAPMNYFRLYYASVVLQDGRVFFAGAEYGNGTTNAEIYNPANDSWAIVPVPNRLITKNNTIGGQGQNTAGFSDSGSIILNNGNVLISPVNPFTNGGTVIFNPYANTLSGGPLLQNGNNTDEGGFVKLPDDSILVIDSGGITSERYIPSLNQWVADTSVVPVFLYDSVGTELGPPFLLPNGNAFYIGSTPFTALYQPSGNSSSGFWIQGPNIPAGLGAPDAPAAMMMNGKILCALSPTPYTSGGTNYVFTTPTYFYEYDYSIGTTGAFFQVHAPNGTFTDPNATFPMRMLDLPDGTVLFTDGGSQLWVYVPKGPPLPAGKPGISHVAWNTDGSVHLAGTLFNGISQGAAYGDDAQMDSNFPIVTFTDGGGNVSYGTTYNWSSTSVQTGGRMVTTEVTIPSNVFNAPGTFALRVIANGIASDPVTFYGPVWVDFNYFSPFGFYFGTYSQPYNTLANGVSAVASGGTIALNASVQPSDSTETMTISKPMTITSVFGPSAIGR
jgi:hypothetical protein